jgi:hypothetical protein
MISHNSGTNKENFQSVSCMMSRILKQVVVLTPFRSREHALTNSDYCKQVCVVSSKPLVYLKSKWLNYQCIEEKNKEPTSLAKRAPIFSSLAV